MVTTQQAAIQDIHDTLKPDIDGVVAYFVRVSELCEQGLSIREAYEQVDKEMSDGVQS
jgi:hypothetical protein